MYHTPELRRTFEQLWGCSLKEYLTRLQEEITAQERVRSRPASPAINATAAAAAAGPSGSVDSMDASGSRIWYDLLELSVLCHALGLEVWLWAVNVHPNLVGIAEPVRIVRKIPSNTGKPLHLGIVYHRLAAMGGGADVNRVFVPISMLGASTQEVTAQAAASSNGKKKGKGTKNKTTH